MAKVKAIAKQTLAGSYGVATEGQEIVLDEKHARQLEKSGAIEITGEAGEDEGEQKEGSFTITDNTGGKEKAEGDTDKANPTGAKKAEPAKAAPKKK